MPDDTLHKAPSRLSQLDVVDPEARAREEAPQDAIWVDWDGPECVVPFPTTRGGEARATRQGGPGGPGGSR